MGGNLEDKFLKSNVPGRYSDHADDTARDDRHRARDSDVESVASDDDDQDGEGGQSSSREASLARMSTMHGDGVPESVYRTIEAQRLGAPQTGVKGVLADYKQSQALEAARRQQEALTRQQVLYRMATGRGPPGSGPPAVHMVPPVVVPSGSDDSGDDDFLEDDEFMQQFRQQRLAEMRAAGTSTTTPSSEKASKPRQYFGEVIDVDDADSWEALAGSMTVASSQEMFLHHLGNTDPGVVTVVHSYEPSIKLCVVVNDHLDKIAAAYPYVKFVKMMASANGVEIDPVAMPVLSIYREGECIEVLTDIAEEVIRDDGHSGGERLSRSDVELVLQKFL